MRRISSKRRTRRCTKMNHPVRSVTRSLFGQVAALKDHVFAHFPRRREDTSGECRPRARAMENNVLYGSLVERGRRVSAFEGQLRRSEDLLHRIAAAPLDDTAHEPADEAGQLPRARA